MKTPGPTSGIPQQLGPSGGTPTANWRTGQLLQATVAESSAGKVVLTIGHRQVSAETSLPLDQGQRLTLQVHSLGKQPVLRILSSSGAAPLAAAIRLLLPRQGAMTPLLSSITQLAAAPHSPLPPLVNALLRSLLRQLPTVETASNAPGLKQALAESGIFLERHLLQAAGADGAAVGPDLKANLLRLLQLLRNWPGQDNASGPARGRSPDTSGSAPPPLRGASPAVQPAIQASLDLLNRFGQLRGELLQQVEAALARLQLNQLAGVPRDGERGLLEWLFELPIRRGDDLDLWSLRVFRDLRGQPKSGHGQTTEWSVQLAFDLPALGPMQARLRLAGQRVSTRFWAERPATLPLLRQHLSELRETLLQTGLEVGELDCQAGPMPASKPDAQETLIREKA